MVWYQEFNATFWITIGGLVTAFDGVIINGIFRSKCKRCKLCCCEIERDVEMELQEEKMELEYSKPQQRTENN